VVEVTQSLSASTGGSFGPFFPTMCAKPRTFFLFAVNHKFKAFSQQRLQHQPQFSPRDGILSLLSML
jgi:hypothetical protein